MLIVVYELNNNNSYAWCLRHNIFSAWFIDIRIYQLDHQFVKFDAINNTHYMVDLAGMPQAHNVNWKLY